MATINIHDLTTINKDEEGVWTSTTCGGIMIAAGYVITAGDPCNTTSGVIYEDDNGNCFECIGYSRTEVRRLIQGTTNVYVKVYVTFDEQGGSSVSNRYVYFGSDGTNSRTYGEYASLPTPTKSGYTFDGWFTASSGGTQITNTTAVSDNINGNGSITQTLYAQWTSSAPTTWTYIGTSGSYNTSVSTQDTGYFLCPHPSVQTSIASSHMNNNYSPGNYSSGHIFRVAVYIGSGFPGTFCSYRYFRAD